MMLLAAVAVVVPAVYGGVFCIVSFIASSHSSDKKELQA
jgi:hypothetical protein